MCEAMNSDQSTLSAVGSHAKTSALPVEVPGLRENEAGYGPNIIGSSAWYDRDTSSWKMWQRCLTGEWEEFSGIWPASGMMRNGVLFRQPKQGDHIPDYVSGLWPTPCAMDSIGPNMNVTEEKFRKMEAGCRGRGAIKQVNLSVYVKAMPCPSFSHLRQVLASKNWDENHGSLNPQFSEWLMGFPINWSELRPAVTQ